MNPDELRNRANRYRAIATGINDPRTIEALHDLAAQYEARADRIEAQRQSKGSVDDGPDDDCG
jgi:hypothetical protein